MLNLHLVGQKYVFCREIIFVYMPWIKVQKKMKKKNLIYIVNILKQDIDLYEIIMGAFIPYQQIIDRHALPTDF